MATISTRPQSRSNKHPQQALAQAQSRPPKCTWHDEHLSSVPCQPNVILVQNSPVLPERLFNKGHGLWNPVDLSRNDETHSRYTPNTFLYASTGLDSRESPCEPFNFCHEQWKGNTSSRTPPYGLCSVEYPTLEKMKEIESPLPSEPSDKASPDNYHREQVQFQMQRQFTKSYQPIQLTKDTSSSSPTQNSSGSKLNEGESSLPVYSFMEYKNTPAVVYIKSETEANSLVQTLKG